MTCSEIAVVDVETTGLSPWRHDRIVEIAIVNITPDGTIVSEYETLVNPVRDIGPTSIHQISAGDVLKAPEFSAIAGDVLELFAQADVIAGHNVSFDYNFLIKEYERIGFEIPQIPMLCTCRLFGRNSLEYCCAELGIQSDGMLHRALTDARATAELVSAVSQTEPSLLETARILEKSWPLVTALKTAPHTRETAAIDQEGPPKFLQRVAKCVHHDVESGDSRVIQYLTLIDRVLEDRRIDTDEEEALVDAARHWNLSADQLEAAHKQYIEELALAAWADGIITQCERDDLHLVAKLLGLEQSLVQNALKTTSETLNHARPQKKQGGEVLAGKRVCFTGELQCTINGERIKRGMAEALATDSGMIAVSGVTKKLDILVVADPNTQSSKARKARKYGIRVLSDAVFWRLAGITVD